jgi:hypothetical protein
MSIVLPAVSTGHPSIYRFSALLTVYSFPLIGLHPIPYRLPSLPIHFYSDHWLFILFRVTAAHSAAPAAGRCSSLRARQRFPFCFVIVICPLVIVPQRLNSLLREHPLHIPPLFPSLSYVYFANEMYNILCIYDKIYNTKKKIPKKKKGRHCTLKMSAQRRHGGDQAAQSML